MASRSNPVRPTTSLGHLGPEWRLLHSVVLTDGSDDSDHLLVGPPGVVALTTRRRPGATVWVGARSVTVDGQHTTILHNARSHAERSAGLLTVASGRKIAVTPGVVLRRPGRVQRAAHAGRRPRHHRPPRCAVGSGRSPCASRRTRSRPSPWRPPASSAERSSSPGRAATGGPSRSPAKSGGSHHWICETAPLALLPGLFRRPVSSRSLRPFGPSGLLSCPIPVDHGQHGQIQCTTHWSNQGETSA